MVPAEGGPEMPETTTESRLLDLIPWGLRLGTDKVVAI
jgi:hypothetical protein